MNIFPSGALSVRKINSKKFCAVAQLLGENPAKLSAQSPICKDVLLDAKDVADDFLNKKMQRYPKHQQVDIGFVDNPEFNAWAIPYDKQFFIGINTGLIFNLRLIFNRMAADPTLFEDVWGEAHPGASSLPLYPDLCSDFTCEVEPVTFPITPERQAIADFLWRDALRFILAHEWCHVANGHLFFKVGDKALNVRNEVYKLSDSNSLKETPWEGQVIEWDADSCAIFQLAQEIIYEHLDMDYGPIYPEMMASKSVDASELHGRLNVLLFAVACVCRLFKNAQDAHFEIDWDQLHATNYPSWLMRWHLINGTVFQYLFEGSNQDSNNPVHPELNHPAFVELYNAFGAYHINLFRMPEEAFEKITGKSTDVLDLTGAYTESHRDAMFNYLDALDKEWNNNIRPAIEKHAWTRLAT